MRQFQYTQSWGSIKVTTHTDLQFRVVGFHVCVPFWVVLCLQAQLLN